MEQLEDLSKNRQKVIEGIVREPLKYLRASRHKGKSCLECILFLQQVRKEIQADSSYAIHDPDPNCAGFHRLANDTVEHYVELFTLLKAAGFREIEVSATIQDFIPDERKGETRGTTVRSYLELTAKALGVVYSPVKFKPLGPVSLYQEPQIDRLLLSRPTG